LLWFDQPIVGDWFGDGADREEGFDAGVKGSAAVEAEDELVERVAAACA